MEAAAEPVAATSYIVIPVWLLWFTVPASGCLSGFLLKRIALGHPAVFPRAACALVLGGIAGAAAEIVPTFVAALFHASQFWGLVADPLQWKASIIAFGAGGAATCVVELLHSGSRPRAAILILMLCAVSAGYVGGLLGFAIAFSGRTSYGSAFSWGSLGAYTSIWWVERHLLFGPFLCIYRCFQGSRKDTMTDA